MSLVVQLPVRDNQTEFNLEVWDRLLADPELAKIEGRIETDRHGQIIMTPPPARHHGSRQSRIAILLDRILGPKAITEAPISTTDGVRAADVVWISTTREAGLPDAPVFTIAPEICVEVLSPSNTPAEMDEKKALYFDAGAEEVWFCETDGSMRFFTAEGPVDASPRCPDFPITIDA